MYDSCCSHDTLDAFAVIVRGQWHDYQGLRSFVVLHLLKPGQSKRANLRGQGLRPFRLRFSKLPLQLLLVIGSWPTPVQRSMTSAESDTDG